MGSVPYIRVYDMNLKDKTLTLEHVYDGRELQLAYTEGTLKYVQELWGYKVRMKTVIDGKELYIVCDENKKLMVAEI